MLHADGACVTARGVRPTRVKRHKDTAVARRGPFANIHCSWPNPVASTLIFLDARLGNHHNGR